MVCQGCEEQCVFSRWFGIPETARWKWGTPLFGGIVFDRFLGQNDKVKSHFRPKCIYVLCALAMLIGASTDMRSITYHPDVKMQEAVLISAKLVLTEKHVPEDK